ERSHDRSIEALKCCGAVESSKRFTTAQSRTTSLVLLLIQNSDRVEIYPAINLVNRTEIELVRVPGLRTSWEHRLLVRHRTDSRGEPVLFGSLPKSSSYVRGKEFLPSEKSHRQAADD